MTALSLPSEAFCADTGELVTFDPTRKYGHRWVHGDGESCLHEITERPQPPRAVPLEVGCVVWSSTRVDQYDNPLGGLVQEVQTVGATRYYLVLDMSTPNVVEHRICEDEISPEGVERADVGRMRREWRKLARDVGVRTGQDSDDEVNRLRRAHQLAVRGRYGRTTE